MFGWNRQSAKQGTRYQTLALIEAIEPRRMLSASGGSAELADGVLDVQGTRRSDAIVVAVDGVDPTKLDVTNHGVLVGQFTLSDVTKISVNGGNGNDRVTIEETLDIPSTLVGGEGKDTLNGGAADDVMQGDNGKDALTGNGGDDSLLGGRGDDRLDGGDGADDLAGGRGNDDLTGDADGDSLAGGLGDDSMDGGAGADDLAGGDGNDHVDGGVGDDHCDGGNGDDDVNGGDGTDDVHGGTGNDHFHAGDDSSEKKDKKSKEHDDGVEQNDDVLV